MPAVNTNTHGKKRKHQDTVGEWATTRHRRPVDLPASWLTRVSAIPTANIPPSSVLVRFKEIYSAALVSFCDSLHKHNEVVSARDRFVAISDGVNIPRTIADTLEGPQFIVPKDYSEDFEEHITEAREEYNTALNTMKQAAVTYIKACHDARVTVSAESISGQTKGVALAMDLQSYATDVLSDAGFTDPNYWSLYINAVVDALCEECNLIRFDVAALARTEREEMDVKKTVMTPSVADTEMNVGIILNNIYEKVKTTAQSTEADPFASSSSLKVNKKNRRHPRNPKRSDTNMSMSTTQGILEGEVIKMEDSDIKPAQSDVTDDKGELEKIKQEPENSD